MHLLCKSVEEAVAAAGLATKEELMLRKGYRVYLSLREEPLPI